MAIHKLCTHGKVLCGLYRGTRQFAHKADNFLKNYGEDIGRTAQALAPAVGVLGGPQSALITGGVEKALETYAQVRNEMD